jgi:SAM-dependent methyltransferase
MARPLQLLPDVMTSNVHGVSVYLNEPSLSESDRREITGQGGYSPANPDLDLFSHVVAKAGFIGAFRRLLPLFQISGEERVLELGGGRGWASALLKREHPACYVVASDLSPVPVSHLREYERILGVEVDERWAFAAAALPFADEQFDVVFTFAAFHHMIIGDRYRETFKEVLRVLRPDGRFLLLYEPGTPRLLYGLTHWRVSRRPDADEDVVLLHRLRELAGPLQFTMCVERFPDPTGRSNALALLYYSVLSKLPRLAAALPCTVNVILRKAAGEGRCSCPSAPRSA